MVEYFIPSAIDMMRTGHFTVEWAAGSRLGAEFEVIRGGDLPFHAPIKMYIMKKYHNPHYILTDLSFNT